MSMSGEDIIKNLKQIQQLLDEHETPAIAKMRIGFLIDDIMLYRNQSL